MTLLPRSDTVGHRVVSPELYNSVVKNKERRSESFACFVRMCCESYLVPGLSSEKRAEGEQRRR
jgi:hypothetical protein